VASGITAPDASLTVPVMEAVTCAQPVAEIITSNKSNAEECLLWAFDVAAACPKNIGRLPSSLVSRKFSRDSKPQFRQLFSISAMITPKAQFFNGISFSIHRLYQ
jgi:hypothetical protein